MADNLILAEIQEAVKTAMRERNKEASTTLRMAISEFKKEEIDRKIEITDLLIVTILHKMIKQRKDAASQFTDANRQELADKEIREIDILSVYLPEQMTESDIVANIAQEVALLGASSMQDMGKVMGVLKSKLQGKADMSVVSKKVKELLNT
jgi:uncharacterized protein YqeY|tara:strand:- start:43 stop:498 length:456 start_codon:yes stop_codon:yes gene_type:complete